MKKFQLMTLLGLFVCVFTFIACGDDDEDDNNAVTTIGITTNDLVGTWMMPGTQMSYTFTKELLTINQWGEENYKGAYTLKDGVLSYSEVSNKLVLLADKSVIVVLRNIEEGDLKYDDLDFIGIKQGKTVNATAKDIEGVWRWPMHGQKDYNRAGLTVKGNTFDLIITPWGQRYTGTFTYNNGMMKLTIDNGYTSREPGTGYGSMEGNMDPNTLEAEWSQLDKENWTMQSGDEMFFVANGNEAYGFIVGLPAIFNKK